MMSESTRWPRATSESLTSFCITGRQDCEAGPDFSTADVPPLSVAGRRRNASGLVRPLYC